MVLVFGAGGVPCSPDIEEAAASISTRTGHRAAPRSIRTSGLGGPPFFMAYVQHHADPRRMRAPGYRPKRGAAQCSGPERRPRQRDPSARQAVFSFGFAQERDWLLRRRAGTGTRARRQRCARELGIFRFFPARTLLKKMVKNRRDVRRRHADRCSSTHGVLVVFPYA